MNIAKTSTILTLTFVALGLFATANPLAAQSTPTAGAAAKPISFEVGEIVANPKTTTYGQQALINRTAGQPSVEAYKKYQGNMKAYHKVTRHTRNGKVMEAVFAHSENSRFAATGSGNRWLVTAVEGYPADPADLWMVDKNNRVLNQIQSKTGWNNARKALLDPKYKGMSILTDQDSLKTIRLELLKAETKAARRGLPLAKEWKAVKDGLKSGRLLSRTPTGAPLPTLAHVEKQNVQALKEKWPVTAKQAAAGTASGTNRAITKRPKANPRVPSANGPVARPVYRPTTGPKVIVPELPHPITPQEAKEFLEKLGKRTRSLGKNLVRRGVMPLFLGLEGYHRYQNGAQIEKDFEAGTINQQQREVSHGENAGGAVGGIAASFGLAVAGAKAGAAAGSVGGPIAAGIGGVAGGLAGGIGGYFGGEFAGEKVAGYLVKKVHAAGTTVTDVAKATKNSVVTAAVSTKDGVVYAAKATANGVATAAVATKDGVVYAAKATANGVATAAVATKNGAVYAAKATANGVATAAVATKNGVVYAAKATANGVATAAVATKNGVVYAAKATANGVATAAVATKNGVVYAATATGNGVVNAASATGSFFKRGWEKFGW
jgi:hypothetical protein